jgi:hypothetical protein
MKTEQFVWGLGLGVCVVALCVNLYLLNTLNRFSADRVVGVSAVHLYCAYYYFCRLSGKDASLVYAVKTSKDERALVGRDAAAALASLFGVLFAFA